MYERVGLPSAAFRHARNRKMMRQVLLGQGWAAVGALRGLSRSAVRYLVLRECQHVNPQCLKAFALEPQGTSLLHYLQAHALDFGITPTLTDAFETEL